MIKITRDFASADRYLYDFGACSLSKGWAQIDTSQDASYFGQWVNPTRLQIFCYCEGDLILTQCETSAELREQIATMKAWNTEHGHRFMGIDPRFSEPVKTALISAGLGAYIH